MPWVGGYLLGDSTKALRFFDEELYKITECWRGRGWFFGLGGPVFAGKWPEIARFPPEIAQKHPGFARFWTGFA